ncbi:hypothetical protein L6R52_11960 [Myxococcota bacterium]|nr:hypothetical protein [Myxococcota bacterium]
MMDTNHFQQAATLVAEARVRLARVEAKHQRSSPAARMLRTARGGAEPDELLGEVTELVKQLRKALDLAAVAMYLLYGKPVRGRAVSVRFPILVDESQVRAWAEILEHALPGVAAKRPDVAKVIAKHQPSATAEVTWLSVLGELSEAAKTRRLRDRDELEELLGGGPIVPMLRRMVQRTGQLVTELRGLTLLRA